MAKKKTNEEFAEQAYNLGGNEYEFLEEYKGARIKILCKHKKCGHEWDISPDNFLRGNRCPNCHFKKMTDSTRKTHEQYEKEIHDLVGDEYEIIGKYTNNRIKVRMKHIVCGYEWGIRPSGFLMGKRCPQCAGNIKKNTEQFKHEVYELEKDRYIVLGKYIDTMTKIKIRHIECGYEWNMSPNSFLSGTRCPKCQHRSYKKTTGEFKQDVYKQVTDEYVVIGEYISTHTKIKMKHNICSNEYEVSPSNFLSGKRCPQCSESKGEERVRLCLKKRNIKNIPQYTFDDCRNTSVLPFDFYLPGCNLLIEYDGIQHFEPIEFFGGQEQFEYQQQNDNIKNQYCKDNNIPLLRIPYWEFDNIEGILFRTLSELEVKTID